MNCLNSISRLCRALLGIALALLAFGSAQTSHAQSATATLSGTVVDEQGAVITGATVTVTNPATTLRRQVMTNDAGFFTVPLLPPGTYTVEAERQGFAPQITRDVTLNVGDQRALQFRLRPGAISEIVTVEGGASLVDESPAVVTVVDREFVGNLPLNGRSFQSLLTLTPGVVLTPSNSFRQGQFSTNGQRESANYFTVDGVSANIGVSNGQNVYGAAGQYAGFSALGSTGSLVSVDALQEFAVQTSTFAPEFGRTPGAQVSIVTRSGTNTFSGALFEYFRNDALDANDFFANSRGLPKPALRNNQFGAVLGGPVLLPRIGSGGRSFYNGRDRAFFFFSYEGLRLRLPLVATREVPSLSARQRATGIVRDVFNAFPLPNGRDFTNGLAEFTGSYSDPSNLNTTGVRIDYKAGEQLSLFGRYNFARSANEGRGQTLSSLSSIGGSRNETQTVTLGSVFVATTRVVNDLRFNYSRVETASRTADRLDNFGGAIPFDTSAVFPSFASPANAEVAFFLTSSFIPNIRVGAAASNLLEQYNLVDTLSVVRGAHQIKIGGDYRRLLPVSGFRSYSLAVEFPNVEQAVAGVSSRVRVNSSRGTVRLRFNNLSLFAQDTWRASQRLTLTYGLRYEINPPPTEANGILPAVVAPLDDPARARLLPTGTPLYETTYNNFAPRIGVSYQFGQKQGRETVLRGGFGVFYDLSSSQIGAAVDPFYFPYGAQRTLRNVALPLTPAQVAPVPFTSDPPYNSVVTFSPRLKLPYTLQFNAAVEQSLGANQTVSATYVGALGRRLYRTEGFIAPNAEILDLDVTTNSGTSDYHAAQFQFTRRLSRGLQALASYTYSHSIDTASSEVATGSANLPASLSPVRQNRASSDFDARHSFSAAATYDIPSPFSRGAGRAIFGGFALDAIFRARSATPVNVFTPASRNGSITSIQIRPDVVPGAALYIEDATLPGGRGFNRDAFIIVPQAAQRQGTLGRNVLRGFPLSQLDFALRRRFTFTERVGLQLKAELFNALNHPNFDNPVGNLRSGLFGTATQSLNRGLGGLNPLYQIGGARSIQLSCRFEF